MKLKEPQKPFSNPKAKGEITGMIEVLIPHALWERLKKVKRKNWRLTLTWISRYALFRLLRHPKIEKHKRFNELIAQDKASSKARKVCHRHVMCFYGEDEMRLKHISLLLRVNLSTLVRVALLWYLSELEAEGEIPMEIFLSAGGSKRYGRISWVKVRDFGTKIVSAWENVRYDIDFAPQQFLHRALLFERDEFW